MASGFEGEGTGEREMASGVGETPMASGVRGQGIGSKGMASGVGETPMASGVRGQGIGSKGMASGVGETPMASGVRGQGIGSKGMASGVGETPMASGVRGQGIGTPETGAAEGAPPAVDSWIQKTFEQVLALPQRRLSLPDAQPVTVLALGRYMADLPPPGHLSQAAKPPGHVPGPSQAAPWPSYYYDITLSDGAYQERCHLCPELNPLVQTNALRCGLRVKVTQCSYLYNQKKLGTGFLCVERLEILEASDSGGDALQEYSEKPPVPLKGSRGHYLPLWNTEDPFGEMWVARKHPQEACFDASKLTYLIDLEESWTIKLNFRPLLVRIMHKARLRYYGKCETKLDVPYQAYFEVADHSGMASMVLWNSLCPEWYNSMKIGTVLLLEQYAIKPSYPFKTQPAPGDLHMKRFLSIEIALNVRDPSTKISIIPEHQVKAEWELPEVKYRFVTRSELDNLPNNHCCDIIGLVQYVGRTQRIRKKESGEDFWMSRCVHVIDGTSEQPFILELFATSQPDIFEQIHPMTYLVCTQMRVIQDIAESGSSTIYLSTTNESQVFITGWHKGQPYTKDTKVKNFIQWINTQNEASHMERMTMGGYYPFPPVPDIFLKYCNNVKAESILTTISEMEEEIESLHYREHKRIAFQGIISAIRYVSCSNTSQEASRVEPVQIIRRSSSQTSVTDSDHAKERSTRHRQTGETTSAQRSPSVQQQHSMETRRQGSKRKIAAVETSEPSASSPCPYFTRPAVKKIMSPKYLKEKSFERKEGQEVKEATQSSENDKEIAGVPARVQAETMCHNSWESALWAAVKDNLTQHLNYSSVFPESFPCKFNYTHKEFLMRQYNLQAARCKPKESAANGEVGTFENACPLEYYEVAILGINHDIAVDVAFLPVCCPEDSHLFCAKGTSSSVVLSHTSGTSCQQESIHNEGRSEIFPLSDSRECFSLTYNKARGEDVDTYSTICFCAVDEVVKAAADLEKQHVICILDICSLSKDKVEVFLNKVYKCTDIDVANQT